MQPGFVISGAGHALVLGYALVAGWFDRPAQDTALDVTEVTLLSGIEFAALTAPEVLPVALPAPTPPAPRPEVVDPPQAETAPVQDAPTAEPAPIPEIGSSPRPDPVQAAKPAPAPRVAPVAAPAPQAPVQPDLAPQQAAQPAPTPEPAPVLEAVPEAAAQPEATTEIVTEAEEATGGVQGPLAPSRSVRPASRPSRQAAIANALEEAPQETADPEATPAPEPTPQPSQQAAAAPGPTGPPMTAGEKDALRVAVQQCWNVGALSSSALRVTVTVAVSMQPDGRPDIASIRQVAADGGSGEAVRQAFETARRAIIRCGARGYTLPPEKYDQWQEIEMVFNPERMRIK